MHVCMYVCVYVSLIHFADTSANRLRGPAQDTTRVNPVPGLGTGHVGGGAGGNASGRRKCNGIETEGDAAKAHDAQQLRIEKSRRCRVSSVKRRSSRMERHCGSCGWNAKAYGSAALLRATSSHGTLGHRESTFPSPSSPKHYQKEQQ